ncbi:MAG: protein translocase SEC61 complex subunit gamma [Conexivisphaera sp.]
MGSRARAGARRRGGEKEERRPGLAEGLRERWESVVRVLKYSRKPGREEYSMFLKIVGLALLVVGGIAFVIHLIATLISGALG